MQWDSLESYLLPNFDLDHDPTEKDTDEKPSREIRLVNAFKKPVSNMYALLDQSVIPIFDRFNMFLQAEEPLIRMLYHSTLRLHHSFLLRFILLEVIAE